MSSGRTVYIAGAGVAGLTLALALGKFGARVVVLERSKDVQPLGTGVQISPNARRVLNQLGLDKAVKANSFEPAGLDVYAFRSRLPVTTLPLGESVIERYGAPYAVMHRADLVDALAKALKRFANVELLFGVRSFDAVSHSRGVSVTIDTADGEGRSGRAFAFIGADGVNSRTRTAMLEGPDARYSGSVAWRALIDIEAMHGQVALDSTSLLLGPGFHAVCYPLPRHGKINVVLIAKEKRELALGEAPPRAPSLPWAMLKSPRFEQLMQAAEGLWGYWPILTVEADNWFNGNIGLIGDAAHAMLPFQAQGAAMAVEDAAILAPLLMTEPSAESALARFTMMRRPRMQRVVKRSRNNGRIYHLEWPFSAARNLVIRAGGAQMQLRRLDWLYGYDSVPEVERAPPRLL